MEPTDEHLDPTSEITLETVKNRTIKGIVALTGRYFVLYIITLIAQGFLGALLTTTQFGVFGIVSAVVNFLVYFSDIGLAASLIQKKEKINDEDLKTTFTVQQILVLMLLIIIYVASPFVRSFYKLDQSAIYLLYALGASLFMSSLKTIPSVLLERHLKFEILAISNILESLVYSVLLVLLAWKGFGISSFTYAVLARGLTGLVTLYIFQPWKPGFAIVKSSLKKLLVFGIPYQLNTFIAVLKDDGLTLILGGIMGVNALGILVWAQKWIQIPLRVVLDNVTRVTFPAFARMQDEKEQLEKSVTRSIFFITLLIFPTVAGIVVLFPVVMNLIPKYHQWIPAILPLTLLAVNVSFAGVTTQLTNLLNAIGKIKITSALMVMWTVLTWVFVPFLAMRYGAVGAASGYALVGTSSVVAIFIVKKYVNFSLMESTIKPLIAAFIMTTVLIVLRTILPLRFFSIAVLAGVGIVVYAVVIFVLVGPSIITDVKKSFSALFTNR